MKEQVDKLRLDANQQLSHKFLVNKAVQAEKKSYPVRWMIVLMAGLGGFLIALLVFGYGTLPRNPLPHLMQPNNRYE